MTGNTAEERARNRMKAFTDMMWHVAVFVIVNGFLWGIDLAGGSGVSWAFWVTITWGIGVAFHVASYFLDENGLQRRRYQRYLAQEQANDTRDRSEV